MGLLHRLIRSTSPFWHRPLVDTEHGSKINIVTLNTWNCQGPFAQRLQLIAAGLEVLGADIILLQEVFAEASTGLHVGEHLGNELGLHMSFAPMREKTREREGVPMLCYSGLAVLSRTAILGSRIMRLPMDERDGERVGQVVKIKMNGMCLEIGNVHLTHLDDADDLRREQINLVTQGLDRTADLVILGGDMNAAQGHAIFQGLTGFNTPTFTDPAPLTTLNPINGQQPGSGPSIIDHIFVHAGGGRDLVARARTALDAADQNSGVYASDHMAVVVDVTLNRSHNKDCDVS